MAELVLRELATEELPKWDNLLDESPQGSVFCRTWWLTATCGQPRVLGLMNHDRLVAGMPLYCQRRFGVPVYLMPKLTQTWGIVMEPLRGRNVSVTTREMEIQRPFAKHLSGLHFFNQCFHPSLQNWLPFHWNGFMQTTRFTYVLDDLTDLDRLWKGMTHQIRTEVRKAEDQGLVVRCCSASELWEMVMHTFSRQERKVSYSERFLQTICDTALSRNQGACFAAVDTQGRSHSAGLVVWDAQRAYYLVSGANPALRMSGSGSLLAWHIVRFVAQRTRLFDFEGSMLEGVERFFRQFGARQVSYNSILKCPAPAYLYLRYIGKHV